MLDIKHPWVDLLNVHNHLHPRTSWIFTSGVFGGLCSGGLISYSTESQTQRSSFWISRVREEVSSSSGRIQSGQNLGQKTHIKLPSSIFAAEFLPQPTTVWMFVAELATFLLVNKQSRTLQPPQHFLCWFNNLAFFVRRKLTEQRWFNIVAHTHTHTHTELPVSLRGSENYWINPHVEQNNFSRANCKLGMWFYLARGLRRLISWSLSVKLS